MIKIIIGLAAKLSVFSAIMMASGCIHIYQSIGHSHGAYVATVSGKEYEPIANRWDYQNKALVYIYRPNSQWAADEVEAPSFYIDDERVFNIRANGYTWFELEPGEYEVVMRRPLFGLEGIETFDLKRIAEMQLHVEAERVYYLRYSEIDPPSEDQLVMVDEIVSGDGPLQLVTTQLAHNELDATRMLPEGGRFIQTQGPLSEDELEEVFDSRVVDNADEDSNTMKWWW